MKKSNRRVFDAQKYLAHRQTLAPCPFTVKCKEPFRKNHNTSGNELLHTHPETIKLTSDTMVPTRVSSFEFQPPMPIRPYRRSHPGTQPEYLHSPYVSSQKRAPSQPLIHLPHTLSEVTGPVFNN